MLHLYVFYRIDQLESTIFQYLQYVLFARFGYLASALLETLLQGEEAHRINRLLFLFLI